MDFIKFRQSGRILAYEEKKSKMWELLLTHMYKTQWEMHEQMFVDMGDSEGRGEVPEGNDKMNEIGQNLLC